MQFSEAEIKFLIQPHRIETATGKRELTRAFDLRDLGCPEKIFQRVLEDRARKLGPKFSDFRSRRTTLLEVPATDLDIQVAASNTF